MNKYETLKHYFGYDRFHAGQEQIVDHILSGRDVLRYADRCRIINLLSGTRPDAAGRDAGYLAFDFADEGPGQRAHTGGCQSDAYQQFADGGAVLIEKSRERY